MQYENPFNESQKQDLPNPLEITEFLEEMGQFQEEPLLDHLQTNPLGRLLQLIAFLPEIRREKVVHARRQLREPAPEIECRFDAAMDRVLEELLLEG